MSNMDNISDQLFAKIRGRFPAVTIGNEAGEVTDDPKTGRYFDFDYIVGEDILGRVSITLTEKEIAVVYNTNFIAEQPDGIKSDWYNFLKEIRNFAKRNMLNFDTRDINKSNLDKRDYAHLTKTAGEKQMSETKMYGTSRTSYEDIDKARLVLKHRQPVNQEVPGARTQHVEAIYIESENGERYKYPMRHLNGARALAQHVSNGGNLYDDFGKHIVSLSEELGKLKQFKTYINRSAVMAEGLKGYMDMVNERIDSIKTEVMKLQRPNYYAETIKDFAPVVMEEVPEDLQNSWIDELTIRTFNEELKSVFPYINRLVKEKNKIKEVGPDEASGPEGSMEPHAHKFYIDGDYDEDRGISDKDCEEMEYACAKAGIKCKCEPDEMRQGGVIIHTMSPRDEVADALDKEGYAVEEAYSPEEDFESAMNMIVGETEDALVNGKGKDQEAAIKKLNGLTAQHFPAGINGTNAVQSLKGIIDDPMLLDMFKKVGAKDSDQCVRPLIMKYIKAKAPAIMSKIDTGDLKMEDLKDKEDYMAKKKALQDIQMDPHTSKDEKMKKELMRKKAEIDDEAKEKGFKEDEDVMKDKIKAWVDKYDGYVGSNGDSLPEGYVQYALNTGIPTDFIETNERVKMDKKYGEEKFEEDPGAYISDHIDEMPITKACMEELHKITGSDDLEDNAELIKKHGDLGYDEGDQKAKFDQYGAMVSMPEPTDKMVDLNDKMKQTTLADHLAKAANVDRTKVYFDDADLVWGSKTVKQGCLVDKECTFADAVDELKSFADANPKAEDDDTINVKMNPDGSIEKDKKDKEEKSPGVRLAELVKSYYDYTTNQFPKGETAVITACEKEFGDKAIPVAQKMIDRLQGGKDREMERIKQLAGV